MKSLFRPAVIIYGLEISGSAIRLVWLEKNNLRKESAALPPGVIKNGKLKNKEKFLEALRNLKSSLEGKGIIPAVVSLPAENVQTKAFNLPAVSEIDLPAAAAVNLQVISPLDARTAYYDWQKLSDGGEFLGAFVQREIAEEFLGVLGQAGFEILAVEFPALAIARLAKEQSAAADLSQPQMILAVSADGLEFSVIKNGELAFSHFVPSAGIANFNEAVVQELQKAIDASLGSNLILITPSLREEIEKTVKEKYPQLRVRALALEKFTDLAPVWYPALGSALRAKFLKNGAKMINLAPDPAGNQFLKLEIQAFAGSWQKAILTVLNLLAGIFLISSAGLAVISYRLESKINAAAKTPEMQAVNSLQEKSKAFNNLVEKISVAENQANNWPLILKELANIGKPLGIIFSQIAIDGSKASVSGKGETELEILEFKNKLAANQNLFKNVNLPLASIISNKDKTVSFSLSFEL